MTNIANVDLPAGDSVDLVFTLTDAAGSAVEPAAQGLSIAWKAQHQVSGTAVTAVSDDISEAANVVTVRVNPGAMTELGYWDHELELTDATRAFTPARGVIIVSKTNID